MDLEMESMVDVVKGKWKSVEVVKDVDVQLDVGNLLTFDPNAIDEDEFRESAEDCLRNIARDNAQLLISQLWKLPSEFVDGVYVAKLTAATTRFPREKAIAKVKQPTKWETFAKVKGIKKNKRSQMIWDEQLKEYRPRWGYKRINDDTKEWVHEVPDNTDPFEDQFEKRAKAKKERIAKNELQHLRNVARNMKGKVPGLSLMPVKNPDKEEMRSLQTVAKKSTASLGKFTESLPKERAAKHLGRKRKFDANFGDGETEKKKAKKVFERIKSNKTLVDANRAANLLQSEKERARSHKRREDEGEGGNVRRSKHGNTKFRRNQSKKGKFQQQGKGGKGGKGGKAKGTGKHHASKGKQKSFRGKQKS